ncbi:MAG: DUF1737 domain-containing protein [Rhodobacteraceae bacterium]|nr:DUF1737 domain-containing protein [Paracoccaceae bacterium]
MRAYRFLTEQDTSAFCHKVTEALAQGWQLYGDPSYAYDATSAAMRCGQAVVKDVEGDYAPDIELGDL